MTEIEPISDETMEKIVAISPFRFAAKITLQNACTRCINIFKYRRHGESAGMCILFDGPGSAVRSLSALFSPHAGFNKQELTGRVKSRQPDYDDGGFSIVSCAEKLSASVLNHSG